MKTLKQRLDEAVTAEIINDETANALHRFWQQSNDQVVSHLLYVLGGIVSLVAAIALANLAWRSGNHVSVLWTAGIYAIIAQLLLEWLHRSSLTKAAAVTAICLVCLVPVIIISLDHLAHKALSSDSIMQLYRVCAVTIISAGLMLLWRYRYSMITLPMVLAYFYLATVNQNIAGSDTLSLMLSGGALMMLGLIGELHYKAAIAFWPLRLGIVAFWLGLFWFHTNSKEHVLLLLFLLENTVLIGLGAYLRQRLFLLCGFAGVAYCVGYFADSYFGDSVVFTGLLLAVGLSILVLGVQVANHRAAWIKRLLFFRD